MKKTIKQKITCAIISGVLMIAVKLPSWLDLKGRVGEKPPNSVGAKC